MFFLSTAFPDSRFSPVANHDESSTMSWPQKDFPERDILRCTVENHGKTLTNLKITFAFGIVGGLAPTNPVTATVDIVDGRQSRQFWIMNACPHYGYVKLSPVGTAQVAGEQKARSFDFISPDDSIHMINPGLKEFTQESNCEAHP
jgi:hypothetical protein